MTFKLTARQRVKFANNIMARDVLQANLNLSIYKYIWKFHGQTI